MLPQSMSSSYQAYKKDTAVLLQWLSDTAEKCGFTSTTQVSKEPSRPSQRLKGKERKKAKEDIMKGTLQEDGESSEAATPREKRKASIKDFLPRAKAIISSRNPTIAVPEGIIKAGLRAASARREFAAWFKRHLAHKETSNKEHGFFIELLEEIIAVLGSNYDFATPAEDPMTSTNVVDPSKSRTETPAKKREKTLENLFSVLDLEEPESFPDSKTEDNPAQSITAVTKSASISKLSIIYDVEDDQDFATENALFAAFCLYEDLGQLREYVSKIWSAYASGNMDLAIASVITNTAFDLARRAEEDFRSAFPTLKSADEVTCLVLSALSPLAPASSSEFLMGWIFLEPHGHLIGFRATIQPGKYPRGHANIYDPTANRSAMSFEEEKMENVAIIMGMLAELYLLKLHDGHLPAQDELTRGLREYFTTQEIPVWLTFACQVHLDIHHALREKAPLALGKLQGLALKAKDRLTEFQKFTQTYHIGDPDAKDSTAAIDEQIRIMNLWFLDDGFMKMKIKLGPGKWADVSSPVEEYYLLKFHPILCGIMCFHIILYVHELSIALANQWGMTLVAHFYNAFRQQKDFPIKAWRDVDLMIEFQSKEHIFFGETPRNMDECYGKFCLAVGYSAAATFSNRRRANMPLASKRKPRHLKNASPVIQVFHSPYLEGNALGSTTYSIEKLLNSKAKDNRTKSTSRLDRTNRLSPLDFLQTFRHALTRLFPALVFDYILLHLRSHQLLSDLKRRLHFDFQALVGDRYNREVQTRLATMCFHTVSIAANFGRFTGITAEEWTKGRVTVIKQAGEALNDAIERFGGDVSNQLKESLTDETSGKPTEAETLFLEQYGPTLQGDETTDVSD